MMLWITQRGKSRTLEVTSTGLNTKLIAAVMAVSGSVDTVSVTLDKSKEQKGGGTMDAIRTHEFGITNNTQSIAMQLKNEFP